MEDLRAVLTRDVVEAARRMVGYEIVRGPLRARITETEAYRAKDDPACHAYQKVTMRNMALFGPPGTAYIYLSYGAHWMLNVAAHPEGEAAGVLVRAAEPLHGFGDDPTVLRGPGKLARAFGITPADNGKDLLDASTELRVVPGVAPEVAFVGTRIGLTRGVDLPWRFADGERLRFVSRPLQGLKAEARDR